MNENMNIETNYMQIRTDKDGNVIFHHPILNQKLFMIDQWMFYMAQDMDIKDLNWSIKQIDKIYSKFQKRFGSEILDENIE